MTNILALLAMLLGGASESEHYSAAVIGMALDKQIYALRIVEWAESPGVCKYPLTDGVRPKGVDLALCKAGQGCEHRWAIYDEFWPENGQPCTQHSEASRRLATAKSVFSEAGLDMKKTTPPIRSPTNELMIPLETVRKLGLAQAVKLSWSWHAIPENADIYGEWILNASAGSSPVVLKRIQMVHGHGGGPMHAFVAPFFIPELRLIAFHIHDPFNGGSNRLFDVVELSLDEIASALTKRK